MLDIFEKALKFTKNHFQQQNTPDLIINIWTYNYYKPYCKTCQACKIYSKWCEEVLEERWKEEWGDKNIVIEKI